MGSIPIRLRQFRVTLPRLELCERVPQPPVNPALRDVEHHDFWPGLVAVLIGAVLAFCGARHLTDVDTVDGALPRRLS